MFLLWILELSVLEIISSKRPKQFVCKPGNFLSRKNAANLKQQKKTFFDKNYLRWLKLRLEKQTFFCTTKLFDLGIKAAK